MMCTIPYSAKSEVPTLGKLKSVELLIDVKTFTSRVHAPNFLLDFRFIFLQSEAENMYL